MFVKKIDFQKSIPFLRHKIWNFFTEIPNAQSFLDVEAEVSGSEDELEEYAGLDLDAYESDGFIVKDGEEEEEDQGEEEGQSNGKNAKKRRRIIEEDSEDEVEKEEEPAGKKVRPSSLLSASGDPKQSSQRTVTSIKGKRRDIPVVVPKELNAVKSMDQHRKELIQHIALIKAQRKKKSLLGDDGHDPDEQDKEQDKDQDKTIEGGTLDEPSEEDKKKKKKKVFVDNFVLPNNCEDDLICDASKFKVSLIKILLKNVELYFHLLFSAKIQEDRETQIYFLMLH